MFVIVWEFRVRAKARTAFLRAYGHRGAWARLFRKAPGYVSTQLLADPHDQVRFFTADVWQSAAAFRSAKRRVKAEYEALDQACEKLTLKEQFIGSFKL